MPIQGQSVFHLRVAGASQQRAESKHPSRKEPDLFGLASERRVGDGEGGLGGRGGEP